MSFNKCFLILCFFQFFALSVYAKDKKPIIEKQPEWITITKVDYSKTNLDGEAEDGYSDLNYEKQVSLQHQAVYYKKVFHILSEAGVQNQSQISVDFEPSYQNLFFHSIKIIRGDQVIDQLKLSNIKTIQQEKDLNRFLYDGSLTAVLFLEDIRTDDIIEYSYTLKGFNPIFKNKYADVFQTKFDFPFYKIFYKLIVPKSRNLTIKNTLTEIQPSIQASQNSTSYEWEVSNISALDIDDNVPSWYDVYPAIMVSEFQSWKDVNDWALELFPFTNSLSGNLQKKVNEIKTKYSSQGKQLLAALRFVQDDVRYMGIEMGQNSHKPHAPVQVFNQRFGDCKDKAYLLCTLLKGLNIEAYPVLNNTSYKKTIANWLPSPHAFDHVTVCVKMDNQSYWFDATIAYQRGPLKFISYPDYQIGLVVQPGNVSLTKIPFQENGKMLVKETFYVKNYDVPVQLLVVTTSSGSFADNIRFDFKNSSVKEMHKTYKDLYTAYFKNIEADSLTYSSDEETGQFVSREYYTIHDFWKEENGKSQILLEPYLINDILKRPAGGKRAMPFALSYPARYEEEIEIHLPESWSIKEGDFKFTTPSFVLSYEYSGPADNIVLLRYSYENKSDHVVPTETSEYLDKLTEAEKTIGFELSRTDSGLSSSSLDSDSDTNKGFLAVYIILSIFALGTYIYRRNRKEVHW